MPSPFPGVDPYLEDQRLWQDFHHTFITYWRESIVERLPDDYIARIDERFEIVERDEQTSRQRLPDVSIMHDPQVHVDAGPASVPVGAAAVIEPVTRRLIIEAEERSAYIEIHRQTDERLVAVLELLSPTNKQGQGYLAYLAKRNELLLQDIHLVELDLLVRGQRLPVEPDLPSGDYFGIVSRIDRRPWCDVYAWRLEDRIPPIPVPLLDGDADVLVDIQSIYDTVYDRGQYARQKRRLYAAPLTLPVSSATRAWAASIVKPN